MMHGPSMENLDSTGTKIVMAGSMLLELHMVTSVVGELKTARR